MIRHTVVFTLKHAKGSAEEAAFLKAADILAKIPGVENFEKLRQVSPKNNYAFGFSMEFADQRAYDGYNIHPDHVAFVRDRWVPEVADFMEIDYTPLGRQPVERPRPGGSAAAISR
ncbi:MAG TPA: Dabb family protein [Rhizobiaceae bacterium]|nr:Dabb family protein [Rhizobiaceae bacterium]